MKYMTQQRKYGNLLSNQKPKKNDTYHIQKREQLLATHRRNGSFGVEGRISPRLTKGLIGKINNES